MGERRSTGETKVYLASLPADADPTTFATIKARWVCEQAHQQLKEELGLGHEGRGWTGLRRHALLAMIALAFLRHCRLGGTRGEEAPVRPARRPSPACRPSARPSSASCRCLRTAPPLPPLPTTAQTA